MLPLPHAMLDESERKLYTLLALRELGSCTHMQLLDFMFENDIMTSFDLSLALHELVDEGHAAKIAHPADSLYTLTEAGQEMLTFFANRIPHSKMQLILQSAPAWRERFLREKQFVAKTTQNQSGEYLLQLKLVESDSPIMSIDIPLPEHSLAMQMEKQWQKHAAEIYQFILTKLGGGE